MRRVRSVVSWLDARPIRWVGIGVAVVGVVAVALSRDDPRGMNAYGIFFGTLAAGFLFLPRGRHR